MTSHESPGLRGRTAGDPGVTGRSPEMPSPVIAIGIGTHARHFRVDPPVLALGPTMTMGVEREEGKGDVEERG